MKWPPWSVSQGWQENRGFSSLVTYLKNPVYLQSKLYSRYRLGTLDTTLQLWYFTHFVSKCSDKTKPYGTNWLPNPLPWFPLVMLILPKLDYLPEKRFFFDWQMTPDSGLMASNRSCFVSCWKFAESIDVVAGRKGFSEVLISIPPWPFAIL